MSTVCSPIIVPAKLFGSSITFPKSDSVIKQIKAGELVILKSAYKKEEIQNFKKAIWEWSESVAELQPGISGSQPNMNFHRTDKDPKKCSFPHLFQQFAFGNPETLPKDLRHQVEHLSTGLLDLQNQLGETNLSLSQSNIRAKAINHPKGGGFLKEHTHTYEPTRVALFLNLSEHGVDYETGGLIFKTGGNWINISKNYEMGDIVAWRQDLPHGIAPVDPESPLSFNSHDGFWIFYVECFEAAKLSDHPRS